MATGLGNPPNPVNARRLILDLCGGTGAWSYPYRKAGYDVRLVTLPEQDVRTYILPPERAFVWGVLAAPPCTDFVSSGARWWKGKPAPDLSVVRACLELCRLGTWWALENPVGRLKRLAGLGEPTLIYHPWEYGDPWTKKTLVWGNFNIPFRTPVPHPNEFWGWRKLGGKGERTKRLRSETPHGFAQAFFEANP